MISGSIRYSNSTGSNRSYGNDRESDVLDRNHSAVVVHDSGEGPLLRTLDDVRQQVAQEVAVRVIRNAEMTDGEMSPHSITLLEY
jgi:hypothetical protein